MSHSLVQKEVSTSHAFIFFLQLAYAASKSNNILKCCDYGISRVSTLGSFGCSLDDAMMNTIQQKVTLGNEFEKIICKTVFKQCCIGNAKSQFCLAGIGMGK